LLSPECSVFQRAFVKHIADFETTIDLQAIWKLRIETNFGSVRANQRAVQRQSFDSKVTVNHLKFGTAHRQTH
jgi:hypothetical protein